MTTTELAPSPSIKLTPAEVGHASPDAKTFAVHLDGKFVGWVGTARKWRDSRYGGLRWWASWREDGDTAARWCSDAFAFTTRKAALAALLAERVRPLTEVELLTPRRLADAVAARGVATRRHGWSDGSADLRVTGSGYLLEVSRREDQIRWMVSGTSHRGDDAWESPHPVEGELNSHEFVAAVDELVEVCKLWADR